MKNTKEQHFLIKGSGGVYVCVLWWLHLDDDDSCTLCVCVTTFIVPFALAMVLFSPPPQENVDTDWGLYVRGHDGVARDLFIEVRVLFLCFHIQEREQ